MAPAHVDPRQIFVPGAMLGGRYHIDAVLAMYGAQVTLLATRTDHRRFVIETLAVERLARRARLLDQLFREAKIPRLFARPNMVEIVDFGVEPLTSNPFLVLAYDPRRPPQSIVMPGAPEKMTAAAFVEVCHGLLDAHDGEILAPANAMPTAVPGAMPTRVPGPLVAPPAPMPIAPPPKSSSSTVAEPLNTGKGNWKWILLSVAACLLAFWAVPDQSRNMPFYNPNITEQTIIYRRSDDDSDPKRFEREAPKGGTVQIASSPSGAQVWAGRRMLGVTPVAVPKPAGAQRMSFVLKKKGFMDKAVSIEAGAGSVDVELIATGKPDQGDGIIGKPEERKGLLDRSLLDPNNKDRFGKDPMRKTPFVDPFGAPGTAPRLPEVSTDPYADDPDEL